MYALVRNALGYVVGIRCLRCNLTSYNRNDIEQRYCGNCHVFHGGD